MNKEKFIELGISEELAAKAEKLVKASLDGAYVTKERFEELNNKLKDNKTDLIETQKQLGVLEKEKGVLETAIKAKEGDGNALADLQEQLANKDVKISELESTHENAMLDLKKDHVILSKLQNAHDPELVLSQMDKSELKIDEKGNIEGLDDQVAKLKESKAFLFKEAETEDPFKGISGISFVEGKEKVSAGNATEYKQRLDKATDVGERVQIKREAFDAGINLQ